MFLYLLFVLFAYYILKPVSQALFLKKFDVDDLPFLVILIAVGGGILAYGYSKLALRISLSRAVHCTMATATVCLLLCWVLLRRDMPWMLYAFSVFVQLFSIVLVTQGWLVASNVFNSREAKRIYPLLGMSLLIGAGFGGEFTRRMAKLVGARNLVLAAVVTVALAWIAFLLLMLLRSVSLARARGATSEETEFSVHDMVRDIGRSRHLQVIIAMMAMIFIVDVLVNFQFQVMAKQHFTDSITGETRLNDLTAFLGSFYGPWLVTAEFIVQLLVTTTVVARFGVGGTLQVMPVSIMLASIFTAAAPAVYSTGAVRLTESVSRYTLNKTGLELLYMPLSRDLRNRIKAFIDIFFDRISRGVGGLLLILFTRVLDLTVREIAFVVIGFTVPWIFVSLRARKEYIATIRTRLAARRLDLENPSITVQDSETVRLLEETAASANPRQAAYALSVLAEAPDYAIAPQLRKLAGSPSGEVRAKVWELARMAALPDLAGAALEECRAGQDDAAARAAAAYVMRMPKRAEVARELLNSSNPRVVEGAIDALAGQAEAARDLIPFEWVTAAAEDANPERRVLAAMAIGIRGDQGTEALHRLLADSDRRVAAAACRAAAALGNRAYVPALAHRLPDVYVRGAVIDSLARYGPPICGSLGDILQDKNLPAAVRRQVPRVLKLIPDQRSVDVLLRAIDNQDLAIRSAVLKALNHLRENAPDLNFEDRFVTEQIYREARYYFELGAALAPFRSHDPGPRTATFLLIRSIEERLRQTLERLFRLLGLRYPPAEIYSTYLAVAKKQQGEDSAAALEFLDNLLDRDLKRVMIPLLDAPEHLPERARDLFGVEYPNAESAVRELIRSRDPWLASCAIAAAGELQFRKLASEIAEAAGQAEPEVTEVARAAREVLT
jgi:ATP/ADP translocase